jgi:hypothetical protein
MEVSMALPEIEWHLRKEVRGHASWNVRGTQLIVWVSVQEQGECHLLTVWWPERQGVPPDEHEVYSAGWGSNFVSVKSSHKSRELAKERAGEVVLGVHSRVIEARRAELMKEFGELAELTKELEGVSEI